MIRNGEVQEDLKKLNKIYNKSPDYSFYLADFE